MWNYITLSFFWFLFFLVKILQKLSRIITAKSQVAFFHFRACTTLGIFYLFVLKTEQGEGKNISATSVVLNWLSCSFCLSSSRMFSLHLLVKLMSSKLNSEAVDCTRNRLFYNNVGLNMHHVIAKTKEKSWKQIKRAESSSKGKSDVVHKWGSK